MALTFLKYRSSCPVPSPTLNTGRKAAANVAVASFTPQRRSQNVKGDFYVDKRCIDCDTCRWMAPETFTRIDRQSAVSRQPSHGEERIKALQALLSCPTGSIHTEKPVKEILEVQMTFPLPVDQQKLPGIYLCGFHSEKSYGATPYLIVHPDGNILVDSPRYTKKLADKIKILGGARYMFLTHKDDVADHEEWSKHLNCKRILHSRDGSVCLYYKPLGVLFTGDHFAKSEESEFSVFALYNKDSVSKQLDSVKKFLELDFKWILPGHGRRVEFTDMQEKNSTIEEFLLREAARA